MDFYDVKAGKVNPLTFTPGSAMLHRGNVPHAAQPITSGERTNFVLWLYGNRGQMPPPSVKSVDVDALERWTVPSQPQDKFAPF